MHGKGLHDFDVGPDLYLAVKLLESTCSPGVSTFFYTAFRAVLCVDQYRLYSVYQKIAGTFQWHLCHLNKNVFVSDGIQCVTYEHAMGHYVRQVDRQAGRRANPDQLLAKQSMHCIV